MELDDFTIPAGVAMVVIVLGILIMLGLVCKGIYWLCNKGAAIVMCAVGRLYKLVV